MWPCVCGLDGSWVQRVKAAAWVPGTPCFDNVIAMYNLS
jgi:hypothetical protein